MDFEYTSYIYIDLSDLRQMYLRVKRGEDFVTVFDDIMSGYDDEDFYNRKLIIEDVREEINRRLKQSESCE